MNALINETMRVLIFATALLTVAPMPGCMLLMAGHGAGMGMCMDHDFMTHDSSMHATPGPMKHTAPLTDTTTNHTIDSSKMENGLMQMDHMHAGH